MVLKEKFWLSTVLILITGWFLQLWRNGVEEKEMLRKEWLEFKGSVAERTIMIVSLVIGFILSFVVTARIHEFFNPYYSERINETFYLMMSSERIRDKVTVIGGCSTTFVHWCLFFALTVIVTWFAYVSIYLAVRTISEQPDKEENS